MSLRIFLCSLLAVLLGSTRTHAMLGDDLTAVEQHYGRALLPGTPVSGGSAYVYSTVGYRVVVILQGGRSVCETFYRLHSPKGFSAETLAAFLKAHADGQTWRDLERSPGRRVWRRDGAMAFYLDDSDIPELVVTTIAFAEPPPPAPVAAAPLPTPAPAPTATPSKDAPVALTKAPAKTSPAHISAVQCHALTKKGLRCTHLTTNPNGFCWQHQIPPKGQVTSTPIAANP